ncbi:inactive leucine-rich repeat receptor-like serine/threonine-protein kinase At1g60630 [Aegilops tauschii subsp. strangulata]|uniref:Protein kinase domain-containing protein n=3 Tax=Aegilops tauschii subsp. strangulata TaxID=200361 RepID=A0A453Q7M5_AEGTS|nr:inactive leucine-rich repeat receptor-like serine/threonine-protein kinase At1g60630 [Aegilops tauschii subsp. strangulata]
MKPPGPLSPRHLLLLLLLYHQLFPLPATLAATGTTATDADALLALKSALDASNRLPWHPSTARTLCTAWPGVRQCDPAGRVTKLVLENLNLTGTLTAALLAPLSQLRVLSLKANALSGPVPDGLAAALPNLKLLYLASNALSGPLPASLALLHRATVLVLSGNRLSGRIPRELAGVPRLTSLLLDGNLLTGPVPALPQSTLRALDVSGNRLSGQIPGVLARRFNASAFAGNGGLCGAPLAVPCVVAAAPGLMSLSPATAAFAPLPPPGGSGGSSGRRRKAAIIAGSTVAGAVVLALLVAAAVMASRRGRGRNKRVAGDVDKGGLGTPEEQAEEDAQHQHHQQQRSGNAALPPATNAAAAGGREFSWEREGIGKLVFCGGAAEAYSLEELLRASAETLGRGEAGSTYKAVMETGFIVTVKRMRCGDAGGAGGVGGGALEFGRRAEELGRVRHPNVVALRAYFQAKEERLLVYDYYPNGSLFSLVHGSRPSSKGKPLHWTSCMKIAEDIAAGLLHLHSSAIVHGNLKPSNVLLGPDFESCLTDYGLVPALHAAGADASSASLLYRAPETRSSSMAHVCFTAASDVYSFGVLLLELLTGRAPFPDLLDQRGGGGADEVAAWVRAAREEEMSTESGGESAASGAAGPAEEKLGALVGVAAACVAADTGARPATAEVLRMVREARAEAMSSSNSSDRSPARWSDAVIMGAPGPPTD